MKPFNHLRPVFRLQFFSLTYLLLSGTINLYAQEPEQDWHSFTEAFQYAHDDENFVGIASDLEGNVYSTSGVTGVITFDGTHDIYLVKYQNTGAILWQTYFNGSGNGDDKSVALKIDSEGNVIVTGVSVGPGTGKDFIIIKYSPSGSMLWVRRINGTLSGDDIPVAMAIDSEDNIIVTGKSQFIGGSFDDFDYRTVKYSSSGTLLWNRVYNGSNRDDVPAAVAVDAAGNVYVTGTSYLRNTSEETPYERDYVTRKYSPVGTTLWTRQYDYLTTPGESSPDIATDIAVDGAGNVIVGGESYFGTVATLIKYNSVGNILWINNRDVSAITHLGPQLAVDHRNEIFVSFGELFDGPFYTLKYSTSGALLWEQTLSDLGVVESYTLHGNTIAVDAAGDVYVSSSFVTSDGRSGNYFIVKYTSGGERRWVKDFELPSSVHTYGADDFTIDNSGNIFVAGWQRDLGVHSAQARVLTVKYSVPLPLLSTIRLNSGGPAVSTGGRNFSADSHFFGFTTARSSTSLPDIGETTDDILYTTWREAVTSGSFSYNLPVVNGTYTVSLHFAELVHTAIGQRRFSVNLEGGPAEIVKLDVYAAAGYGNAIVKTFAVSVTDGMLNIDFTNVIGRAMISAIEVVPPIGIPIEEWPLVEAEKRIFNVFPNPAHDKLIIQTNLEGEIVVQVADQMGNIEYLGKHIAGDEAFELDISFLKPGLYIVRLIGQDGITWSLHVAKE